MKLRLSKQEKEQLNEQGSICIERNGFTIYVEQDDLQECGYLITIECPYTEIA